MLGEGHQPVLGPQGMGPRGSPRLQPPSTYVGVLAEEVEAVLVDGQDAGRGDGVVAAALDVEEGRAEQGVGAQQPCGADNGGSSPKIPTEEPRGGNMSLS